MSTDASQGGAALTERLREHAGGFRAWNGFGEEVDHPTGALLGEAATEIARLLNALERRDAALHRLAGFVCVCDGSGRCTGCIARAALNPRTPNQEPS